MDLRPPPVKRVAVDAGIDVLQPDKARDPALHEALRRIAPDVAIVVAYGKILPPGLLAVPGEGFVNVHFSLLPAYRGAAPVPRAIIDGCSETGVSIMVLTEGMDEGPVLATERVPIAPRETAGELGDRLARVGADLLVPTVRAYLAGDLRPVEQDHDAATYAPKIAPDEARIDWAASEIDIDRVVRGLDPTPGAWTMLGDARVKVYAVEPLPAEAGMDPGELRVDDGLVVGTGGSPLRVLDAQVAGRRRMSGAELARGLRVAPGARFT
jgi:methionyl-tRNA formyltransferase